MNKNLILMSLLCSVLLVGCSSKPSESDAKKIIEETAAKNSKGVVKLTSFSKTDGVDFELMGMKGYEMSWKGTFEVIREMHVNPKNFCVTNGRSFHKEYAAGETFETGGKIVFQKTENGWKGSFSNSLGCYFG